MKQKLIIIVLTFLTISMSAQKDYCKPEVLQKAKTQLDSNAIVLKEFQDHVDDKTKNGIWIPKYSMYMEKNTLYQISLASSDEYPGKAYLTLYSGAKSDGTNGILIGSTYNKETGKMYKTFKFKCQQSNIYIMYIHFIDGKEGCAAGVVAEIGKF